MLAAGSVLGVGLYARRGHRAERVDLYFADGSMVSFAPGSPEGDRLLFIARRVLAAARG